MAIRNLTVNYPTSTTKGVVLTNLKEAFTSTGAFASAGVGMTLIEDSISGSDFFVVQAQQPTEPKSQMIIEVKFINISSVDYVWFTLWETWTPGAPGSGAISARVTDHGQSNTTGTASRSHRIDLTDGGNIYVDTDDVSGLYCAVHSDRNIAVPVNNSAGHFFSVCSVEKSALQGNSGVNYGVLAFSDASVTQYLVATTATDHIMWVPPINHDGNSSDFFGPSAGVDRAAYAARTPWIAPASVGVIPSTGRASTGFDTYNDGELSWPLFIGNMGKYFSNINPSVGAAFGYRGVAHGLFGYPPGAVVGWRSTVTDDNTGKKYLVYPTDGLDGTADIPKLAIEKA